MANVLLVIAQKGFQTKEYYDPKRVLEQAGHTVVTASVEKGGAVSNIGEQAPVDIALADVRTGDYDGVFVIGGPGAIKFLDNDETARIMKEAEAREGMPYGAICVSPRILAKAGVLRGKKVTGWNEDGNLEGILKEGGVVYEHEPVVTDGRIVTADGPGSAEEFGKAITRLLRARSSA
ncbi:MAG: DJ-1/PfpI family protein [bacterium]|nr:DJ-1/PfpI family protein [bacterium]